VKHEDRTLKNNAADKDNALLSEKRISMPEKDQITSESVSVSRDRRLKELFIYGLIFLFATAVAIAGMTYYLTNVRAQQLIWLNRRRAH